MKNELEELRAIRAAERARKEQEALDAAQKDQEKEKRNAFLQVLKVPNTKTSIEWYYGLLFVQRAAVFTQKKGPSDTEVKEKVQKASYQRKLNKQLEKMLQAKPSNDIL